MHDVFHLHDLTDDAQHRLLLYWLDIARRDRAVPLAAFDEMMLPPVVRVRHVLWSLSGSNMRKAVLARSGPGLAAYLGTADDPVGMSLEELLPPSYVNDIVPAYAVCASTFRPLSSLDLITYADGSGRLLRRLVLPIGRPVDGGPLYASHLLVAYAPAGEDEEAEGVLARPGHCGTMRRVDSVGIALFKDAPAERPVLPCTDFGL
jgi:hypothetical protein